MDDLGHQQVDDRRLENLGEGHLLHRDERQVVQVQERPHQELAVHAVGDAAVAGDGVAKVLDGERALQPQSEEPAKGGDQRRERRQPQPVGVDGLDVEGVDNALEEVGHLPQLGDEHGVVFAVGEVGNVGAQVLRGTDKVVGGQAPVDKQQRPDHGADPGTDKPFNGLLGRQLNELSAAEGDATEVGEDVVGDDEGAGEEEPDDAVEDVFDDEMRLVHDDQKRHVGDAELGKLELIVTLLQREHKRDKTGNVGGVQGELVVGHEEQSDAVCKQVFLEKVKDIGGVQKVHRRHQKVPIEQLGEGDFLISRRFQREGDDLLERQDLQHQDKDDQREMAAGKHQEEAADHDERPDGSRDKRQLLLLGLVDHRLVQFLLLRRGLRDDVTASVGGFGGGLFGCLGRPSRFSLLRLYHGCSVN